MGSLQIFAMFIDVTANLVLQNLHMKVKTQLVVLQKNKEKISSVECEQSNKIPTSIVGWGHLLARTTRTRRFTWNRLFRLFTTG